MKHTDLYIDNITLMEECRAGDRVALSLFYTRFAPRMLHVISRYVNNMEDAHDILHDGFIVAFTRLDSLRDPEHIDYWLATIMKNLSLKFLQSQNIATILKEIPDEIEEISDIDEIIDFETLEGLIKQLPDGYQKVFRLAVLENKSHKEISKILGIAPNSSSSQLFHAKVMLRRLIEEHRKKASLMISLLLIAISAGLLYLTRYEYNGNIDPSLLTQVERKEKEDDFQEPKDKVASVESDESEEADKPGRATANTSKIHPVSPINSKSSSEGLAITESKEQDEEKETENPSVIKPSELADSYKEKMADLSIDKEAEEIGIPNKNFNKTGKWSAGINFDSGIISFDGFGSSDLGDMSQPPQDSSDPLRPSDENEENANSKTRASDGGLPDNIGNWSHRHYLPITFGISMERRFNSWAGIESGIAYSYLHSDYEGNGMEATCHWHYLDIPLKINLYAYDSEKFSFFGSLGVRLSIPVYSIADVHDRGTSMPNKTGSLEPKPVWSVGAGIGVSYRVSKHLNIYIESSLQYHFPQECKVPNIWTDEKPWSFSLPVGLRLNW